MNKVTENIFSIGVLNPNLRIFDVVMKTEYGTSYNAYAVCGESATALIDCTHLDFFEEYIAGVQSVCDVSKIEYLVMNHNEPDHSGAICKLLEIVPDIKIIVSQAGALYLKNIVNCECSNIIIAKDGDEIDLGGKTLKFISASFLHWPDSIFTYVKEDRVLFSCDFLGAHYCEPRVFDSKMLAKRKAPYDTALLGYYNAIFGPFKPYVRKGLEKIRDLEIDFACTSHGPILTKAGLLPEVLAKYAEWSTEKTNTNKNIPLFYCSAYNNTGHIAEAIACGIREALPEAIVNCYDLNEHSMDEMSAQINEADAFLVGSPTINRDAVPPIWHLLACVDAVNSAKKPAAIFGSYGWSGEAFANIRARLSGLRIATFEKDCKVIFVPTVENLRAAKDFGAEFAMTLK